MNSQHKAFTLIELLVVIAIIAILAAILFPVFAQAKTAAKFTAALSQSKQVGTAMIIYSTDTDDVLPMAQVQRPAPDNSWGSTLVYPVPYNAINDAVWSLPERQSMAGSFWANSIYPYLKNINLYKVGDKTISRVTAGDVYTPGVAPVEGGNLTFNGLLHTMSSSEVVSPSGVILLWPGRGTDGLKARMTSMPQLVCSVPNSPCKFNADGPPQGAGWTGTYQDQTGLWSTAEQSAWIFGNKRQPMVRTDSSAKSYRVGSFTDPQDGGSASSYIDPFSVVSRTGGATSTRRICRTSASAPTTSYHWCFFSPLRDQ